MFIYGQKVAEVHIHFVCKFELVLGTLLLLLGLLLLKTCCQLLLVEYTLNVISSMTALYLF